ncbi:MAG: hypothetical protein L0Z07_03630 [Planctomycetes bacterium]|nr:hypothetical protein [Planctomycetota bacterium]
MPAKPFSTHPLPGEPGNASRLRSAGGVRRRLLLGLVLLTAGVAVLPTLVAKTPLRNSVLSAVMPSDVIRASVGDASLGWLSPPSLSAVEVRDAAGATLLTIESVHLDRPLWSLVTNTRDLGSIEIVRPKLHVEIRPNGSNVEDVVGELLADLNRDRAETPAGVATAEPTTVAVRLVDGTVLAHDATTGRSWGLQGIQLQFDSGGAGAGGNQFAASGQFVAMGQTAGQLAVSLAADAGGRNQLSWQADSVTLGFVEPWLRRYVVGAEMSGALVSRGTATWTGASPQLASDFASTGTLHITQLDTTAAALAGDRLRLQSVELPWQLRLQPGGLVLDDLRLRSDLGQLAVRGVVDRKSLVESAGSNAAALDAAAGHDFELRGALDLARLAGMLPHALRIREDTQITSGTVEISVRHQPAAGGQLISGNLRSADLVATSGGRPLRWDEPMNASFAVQRENGVMRLNTFRCESEFLKMEASGTTRQLAATASFDLNRLVNQVGQFVDLSGTELAGAGSARLNWNLTGEDQFSVVASGELAQLRVALAGGKVWAEPQLALQAEAAGAIDPVTRRPARIDTGKVGLRGQGDELDAQLTAPVAMVLGTPTWPVAIRGSGSMARWLTRARPWVTVDPWQIDGELELVTSIRIGNREADAQDAKLTFTNLRATAPGWNISEPRGEIAGDAHWNGNTDEMAANNARLVTSTVSLAVKDFRYRSAPPGAGVQAAGQMHGMAAYRADLARLATWRTMPGQTPAYQPRGSLLGNVRFEQRLDGIRGEITATGQNLVLAQWSSANQGVPGQSGYQTIWQEPQATARGAATFQSAADRLVLDEFRIQSNTLQATAGGQVERLSTTAEVNLSGTVDYDLAQITPLLRPYVGNGIQFTGREQARVAIAGQLAGGGPHQAQLTSIATNDLYPMANPSLTGREMQHWSRRLKARLEAPWSGANVYGLSIGPGRIAAVLGEGAIRVDPISLTLGEGQLTAAPSVRLDPLPAEMTMPPGPVLTNVRITPEVSEAMLKYVAPVLAGTTQSEGQFSLQIDGVRMPLGEALRTDATGKLTVHSVRVVPGPLADQWIGLARQIEALAKRRDPAALTQRPPVTLLAIRDQQVNFRVADGRVYHDQMEFLAGDVVLRSQGSVGLDESLALVLQVPIQDRWVEKEKLLVGLKGQSLSIPISGTLSRPQMDQQALANLSQQLLQSAAQQAIGGELNKALENLFKSR